MFATELFKDVLAVAFCFIARGSLAFVEIMLSIRSDANDPVSNSSFND